MHYLAYSILFLWVLFAPCNQKPQTLKDGIWMYENVYGELFSRIDHGDIHKDDAKLYLEGAITVRQTNCVEGEEYASEVIDVILLYSPKEFIHWYKRLAKEDKPIILDYLSYLPENANVKQLLTAVEAENTPHKKAKREVLDAIQYNYTIGHQDPGPDMQVGPLRLHDSDSIINSIGDQMPNLNRDAAFPSVQIANEYGEILELIFHPGSVKNEFSRFHVFVKPSTVINGKGNHYTTESGIELGMSREYLRNLKGKNYVQSTNNGRTTLTYTFDDCESDFLKKYNELSYSAVYTFEDNILVEYEFGFDYP